MDNWKQFYIDSNYASGLVSSSEEWDQMLAKAAKRRDVLTIENAKTHLLKARLRPGSEPPSFGFYPCNTGITLQKWMAE